MAKKAKKKNVNKKNKKVISIPAVAIIDNIVFSEKEAWAYYKIGSMPYDFLTGGGRASLSSDIMNSFSSLAQRSLKNIDLQLLVTNTPVDIDSWESQMIEIYEDWNGEDKLDTFDNFMRKQTRSLKQRNYKKKVAYLGVKLFTRGTVNFDDFNILDFGFENAYEMIKKSISTIFVLPDETVSESEQNKATSAEAEIFRSLRSGALRGTRLSSEEILLITKKVLYPAMPTPYLEVNHEERIGLNDIVLETGAIIEDHRRYLKIKQMINGREREGYRATLSFSKFPPGTMGEPHGIEPFMYLPTIIGLPFTMSARATLMPVDRMKKDLQKKKLENEDELDNLAGSGQRASSSVIETQRSIDKLDAELNTDNMPWVSGNYRMTIETGTLEVLNQAIDEMKQEYSRDDVVLTQTSGDQLELMMEEMPGGTLKINDFAQLTNLAMLGVSGFNYGGDVGDPIREPRVKKGGKR